MPRGSPGRKLSSEAMSYAALDFGWARLVGGAVGPSITPSSSSESLMGWEVWDWWSMPS